MKMKKKGAWSEEEDQKLAEFIKNQGVQGFKWEAISHMAGLNRCGKSCRLRWKNYLSPHIRRGNFSKGEETIIIQLQKNLGNKWSQIAAELPGRTDNDIKNFWNTKLRKKLKQKAKTEYSAHSQTPTTDIQTFLANYPMSTFNILPCFVNLPQSQVAHNLLLQELWEREQQAEVVIAPTPNYYHNFLTIMQPGYAFGNELYNLNGAIPFEFQTNSSSDAWFGGGLSENSLDSNAVGMCSNNDLTECHMPPDPLVSAATDDEISMSMTDEFYVNPNSVASSDYEWIPYEMNYEFPDMQQKEILASFLGLSPSLMDNASSSKLYDGASYSFYDDLQS